VENFGDEIRNRKFQKMVDGAFQFFRCTARLFCSDRGDVGSGVDELANATTWAQGDCDPKTLVHLRMTRETFSSIFTISTLLELRAFFMM